MTVIKINALTVPAEMGEEVARRFAARAGAVDGQEGFEGFELLRPTDERTTWLVLTRWRDDASFEAWRNSPAFGQGHRPESQGQAAGGGPGHGGGQDQGGGQGHGAVGQPPSPMPIQAELWSYEVEVGSSGS